MALVHAGPVESSNVLAGKKVVVACDSDASCPPSPSRSSPVALAPALAVESAVSAMSGKLASARVSIGGSVSNPPIASLASSGFAAARGAGIDLGVRSKPLVTDTPPPQAHE
jgi:hypothetical protein